MNQKKYFLKNILKEREKVINLALKRDSLLIPKIKSFRGANEDLDVFIDAAVFYVKDISNIESLIFEKDLDLLYRKALKILHLRSRNYSQDFLIRLIKDDDCYFHKSGMFELFYTYKINNKNRSGLKILIPYLIDLINNHYPKELAGDCRNRALDALGLIADRGDTEVIAFLEDFRKKGLKYNNILDRIRGGIDGKVVAVEALSKIMKRRPID